MFMDEINNVTKTKTVILCIHGFLTGNYHDFDYFKSYVKDRFDGEIELVKLYDYNEKSTYDSRKWGKIAEDIAKDYLDRGYIVNIIGYSMGASIAAYVASRQNINKAVFIAPYIKLLGTKMLTHNIKIFFKTLKLRFRYRKDKQRYQKIKKRTVSISLLFQVLFSVRRYRRFYRRVFCETLIIMGLQDTSVPLTAASKAYRMIKSKMKQLWLLDHLDHVFIFSKEYGDDVFDRILKFFN
jgi:esterase/lipase